MEQGHANCTGIFNMIKKYLFYTCLACIFFPCCLHAQLSIGLEGGSTYNTLKTNNTAQVSTNYIPAYGFTVSAPFSYKIKNWFSVESGISYIQKNYQVVRTGFYQGISQYNRNAYLQIPVKARLSLGGKKLRGFVNAGFYGAYWAGAHVKGTEPNILNPVDSSLFSSSEPTRELSESNAYNYSEKYSFDSRKDRRMEWGLIAGVGISYQASPTLMIFVEGNYSQSFSDQQKNYMLGQVPRYNQTFSTMAGVMVPFKNLFKF
jgi:hypothetical protein